MAIVKSERELLTLYCRLPADGKTRLLADARRLTNKKPRPIPGKDLVQFFEKLNLPPKAVDEMEKAIEECCERIDPDDTITVQEEPKVKRGVKPDRKAFLAAGGEDLLAPDAEAFVLEIRELSKI